MIYYKQINQGLEMDTCERASQLACSQWQKEINDSNVVIRVFIDLKRAFELKN